MQIIHQTPLAALGLGAAFTVIWGVADPVAALAEVRVIEADGYYIMGDGPEENAAVAKERARADARRAASEQAGLYVAGMTEVKKGKLTRDEIRTISAAVLEVKEDNVTPEVLGGTVIQYHCHMKAVVDTGSITDQLRQDRQTFVEAVQRNKELEAENARISAELAELKERYKTASEAQKQEINREVKRNEDEFTAMQWNEKGVGLVGAGDSQGAIKCFQKAVAMEPNYAVAWSNLGFTHRIMKEYEKAIEYCQKAIRIDPAFAVAWSNLGACHDGLGNYGKALECYQKAVELDSQNAVSWGGLGHVHYLLKQYGKADECARRAVELDPKLGEAWAILGAAQEGLGVYDKAVDYCQRAIQLNPNYALGWYYLGLAHNQLGDKMKAIECYRKAVELSPDEPSPWASLGVVYAFGLGQYSEALKYFDKACSLSPNDKELKEMRDLVKWKAEQG